MLMLCSSFPWIHTCSQPLFWPMLLHHHSICHCTAVVVVVSES